ncbi:MAG TPA: NmrA/HSCARG family protein [Thermoanaerobaculia bacterium]|nr:NmrA/HSCARG family protein [Thermoanaerobaculia bacterium]
MTGSDEAGYQFALKNVAQPKRIIAVVGATGAQGGGLVRAIADDPKGGFTARAITRDVNSDKAKALAALGAEVVAADVDDPESLLRAFEGAYGAYCVTFFWDHFSPEKELAQARALATAARDANVQHVIWSTLEDTRNWVPLDDDRMPTLMERYKVPHFDAKGEADAIFAELGVPVTYLLTSFYWDNFISFGMGPTRDAEGKLAITLPMGTSKLPGIAADDIGRSAYGIFKVGTSLVGKRVGISGEHLSGEEMAAAFSAAIGEEVSFNAVEPEVYRGFGFPGAEDLGNMFQFKRDFETSYRGARDIEATRLLNPKLRTFAQWLEENKSRLNVPNG